MLSDTEIKRQVREFYDQVGWQQVSEGFYQNAIYEDLRPVTQEYIHKCHVRVHRYLSPSGHLLLDAGSGPIQYPEYLEYSAGYHYRVCADLSFVALQEARLRIGAHGLFVVCDIANLPFKSGAFDGMVSLHTIHHLPPTEHKRAYQELHRTLAPSRQGVIVNGWDSPPLVRFLNTWVSLVEKLSALFRRRNSAGNPAQPSAKPEAQANARGTYIQKYEAAWLINEIGNQLPIEIWCWRSLSVRILRTLIQPHMGGKWLLKIVYSLEELFPHFMGKNGQYPLIVLRKEISGNRDQ